jgi:hypothetical protein
MQAFGCGAARFVAESGENRANGQRTTSGETVAELAGEVSSEIANSEIAKERGLVSETKPLRRAGYVGEG